MGQNKKEGEMERLGMRVESMKKKSNWIGQRTQAERRDMCKNTILKFLKKTTGRKRNEDIVRTKGETL